MSKSNTAQKAGTLLLDRYQMERFLAEGGMGKVYLARDKRLNNRKVVIKFPSIDLLYKKGFRERFQQEVSTLIDLDLSGVITVHDYGEYKGHPFVVLQYLANGSLDDKLGGEPGKRTHIQSVAEVLEWASPLAKTLDNIHRNGVIHRDVKPGNILFDREDSAYLSDFGIIKVLKSLEESNSNTYGSIGSPGYMAPEYINRELSAEYDQYLLATTIYESLSGSLPFEWETPDQYRIVVATQVPRPLIKLAPHLSEALSTTLMKSLNTRPSDRHESCQALITEIRNSLSVNTGDTQQNQNNYYTPPPSEELPNTDTPEENLHKKEKPLAPRKFPWFKAIGSIILLAGLLGGGQYALGQIEQAKIENKQSANDVKIKATKQIEDYKIQIKKDQDKKQKELEDKKKAKEEAARREKERLIEEERIRLEIEQQTKAKRISQLLQQAKIAIAKKQLTSPLGESAKDYIVQILEIAPQNIEAISLLTRIVSSYHEMARQKILKNSNLAKAEAYLVKSATLIAEYDLSESFVDEQTELESQQTELESQLGVAKERKKQDEAKQLALDKAKAKATHAYEPRMVSIQGGRFQMGCVSGSSACDDDEKVHTVNVNDFLIGETEVTVKQYMTCVNAGHCRKPEWLETGSEYNIHTGSDDFYKQFGSALTNDKYPIIGVSWHDAVQYTQWLKNKTNKAYRLPTEAEWEYAARGGTSSVYPWGNNIGNNQANCNSGCGDGYRFTAPVGSFSAHNGLYDMQGNVWEWTCSAYEHNYNGSENSCVNKNNSRSRVLRGGSWDFKPKHLRSANRYRLTATKRGSIVGFRVVRTR